MNALPIDAPRLLRIATLAFTVLAGALVYFGFEPQVDSAQMRLDDAEANLRSDDVAFSEVPRLRAERTELARRYDTSVAKNPEATFVRELASTVERHGVELVSTTIASDGPTDERGLATHPSLFKKNQMTVSLRGTYGHLLATIRDLSTGTAIVDVGEPTMRRDDGAILADVPATIYEPTETR